MRQSLLWSVPLLALVPALAPAADDKPANKPPAAAPSDSARPVPFDAAAFIERFDKNKDGFIQRDEMPERFRHAFDLIDTNKDGKLSREELEQGSVYLQRQRRPADFVTVLIGTSEVDETSPQELQYVYDMLRKIDKNNDGKLDAAELKAAREQLVTDRVDEIIKELDANNDGKISREEAYGRLKRDFDKIDANKDGFLDREELLKAAAERAAEKAKEPVPTPKSPSNR